MSDLMQPPLTCSSALVAAVQCQFHGDILFSRDVSKLFVAPRHSSDMSAIDEFAKKNGIELKHIDVSSMQATT